MVTRVHCAKLILATAALCVALSTYAFAGQRGSGGRSGDSGSRHQPGDRSASRDSGQQNNNRDDFARSRDGDDSADARESERSRDGQERGERSGFFNRRGDEKAVETKQEKNKAGERESSEARTEKSEVAKKFDSSLLLADVAQPDRSRDGHPKLNEHERDMAKQILKDNFTDAQLQTLKETLKRGELTDKEQGNLHEIFNDKFTDKQEKLVVEYLQELTREEHRRFEKKSGPSSNPGLDHMSQQGLENSQFGRVTAQQAIDAHGSHDAQSGHHSGSRQGEHHRHDLDHHPRLSDREQTMAKNLLNNNFTDEQLQKLKETLKQGGPGEMTDKEKRNLRHIFNDKFTDRQEKLVLEYLQELMHQEHRHFR